MIPLSVPHLKGNELKYVSECIETEWVSSAGKFVNRFEEKVAQYVRVPYAVACVNGTAALHMSLLLCDVKAGEEVIVPTLTFIAPVNAIHYVGAHPVFMDCDDHLNLDPEKLEQFLAKECMMTQEGLVNRTSKRKIKAIIAVHVFGHPCDLRTLTELARRYGLMLIEDAAEAIGSYCKNNQGEKQYVGTAGFFGCLSFNGNKVMTTGGGGMILTSDPTLARRARYLTQQAKDDEVRFIHHEVGYNYRLTNLQAALGCAQLEQLDHFIAIKRQNFSRYKECLGEIDGLSFIEEPVGTFSNRWHYTLVVDEKKFGKRAEQLRHRFTARQIETRPLWELNHRQKPYRECQTYHIEKALLYHDRCLNVPCSVNLTAGDLAKVVQTIQEVHGQS